MYACDLNTMNHEIGAIKLITNAHEMARSLIFRLMSMVGKVRNISNNDAATRKVKSSS